MIAYVANSIVSSATLGRAKRSFSGAAPRTSSVCGDRHVRLGETRARPILGDDSERSRDQRFATAIVGASRRALSGAWGSSPSGMCWRRSTTSASAPASSRLELSSCLDATVHPSTAQASVRAARDLVAERGDLGPAGSQEAL